VGSPQAKFIRMKSASKKRTPSIVNLTVKRHYLTQREIERLMDGARKLGRYGHRDATMILVAYRHGLRASEVCDLQWQQIELSEGHLHVHRVKNGIPSVHPIRSDEMRALRKLRCEYPKDAYVFVSERGGPNRSHRFPPPHPARRRGCQHAIPDPPPHASQCLRVQARQRRP
jgi:integrase